MSSSTAQTCLRRTVNTRLTSLSHHRGQSKLPRQPEHLLQVVYPRLLLWRYRGFLQSPSYLHRKGGVLHDPGSIQRAEPGRSVQGVPGVEHDHNEACDSETDKGEFGSSADFQVRHGGTQ